MHEDFDPLQQAALTSAQYGSFTETPALVSAVLLTFEFRTWLLTVEEDDDTVRIVDHVPNSLEFAFSEPPPESPWEAACGTTVMWAWAMENQQGYVDGLQFSFGRQGREERLIQLIAMSSAWQIVSWALR